MTTELQDHINRLFADQDTKISLDIREAVNKEDKNFLVDLRANNHLMRNEFGKDSTKYLNMN